MPRRVLSKSPRGFAHRYASCGCNAPKPPSTKPLAALRPGKHPARHTPTLWGEGNFIKRTRNLRAFGFERR